MESQNVGCLIPSPYRSALHEPLGQLLNPLWQFLVDGPVRDLFPHVLKIDFPLIVLELCAYFLNFLIDLLAVKVY